MTNRIFRLDISKARWRLYQTWARVSFYQRHFSKIGRMRLLCYLGLLNKDPRFQVTWLASCGKGRLCNWTSWKLASSQCDAHSLRSPELPGSVWGIAGYLATKEGHRCTFVSSPGLGKSTVLSGFIITCGAEQPRIPITVAARSRTAPGTAMRFFKHSRPGRTFSPI